MGKVLVPEGSAHFSHLGHPKVRQLSAIELPFVSNRSGRLGQLKPIRLTIDIMHRCKLHFQLFSVLLIPSSAAFTDSMFLSTSSMSWTMMSELISLFSVCDAWGQWSITIFGTLSWTSLLYSMCSCLKFSIFLPLVTENLLKQNFCEAIFGCVDWVNS